MEQTFAAAWAVNRAVAETLGVKMRPVEDADALRTAKRILSARRAGRVHLEDLPKLGVVMKRAQYFLTASGKIAEGLRFTPDSLLQNLIALEKPLLPQQEIVQLSLFDSAG